MSAPNAATPAIGATRLRKIRIAFGLFAAMMLPGYGLVESEAFGPSKLLAAGPGAHVPFGKTKSASPDECLDSGWSGHRTARPYPRYIAIGLMRGRAFARAPLQPSAGTERKGHASENDDVPFEPMVGIVDYTALSPEACTRPAPVFARPSGPSALSSRGKSASRPANRDGQPFGRSVRKAT